MVKPKTWGRYQNGKFVVPLGTTNAHVIDYACEIRIRERRINKSQHGIEARKLQKAKDRKPQEIEAR